MSIGVGVITYNRPEAFKKCIEGIPTVDEFVVVNDGAPYPDPEYPSRAHVIQHEANTGVAGAKNSALRYLMEKGCEHIFLIEDDIEILNPVVFQSYIKAAQVSGILHMGFAHTFGINRVLFLTRQKHTHDYGHGVVLTFNRVSGQPFVYYHRSVIEEVGYYDETFVNDVEYYELTYRVSRKFMCPPPFWYPDLINSRDYLKMQTGESAKSTIGSWFRFSVWIPNHLKFINKYGFIPYISTVASKDKFLKSLTEIQKRHAVSKESE